MIDVVVDFAFVKTVVSARENVEPEGKQFFRNERRNAKTAGAVFRIRDRKIDLILADQRLKIIGDNRASTRSEDVADEENVHSWGAQKKRYLRELPTQAPSLTPRSTRGESSERLQASPWHPSDMPELAHRHLIRAGLHDIDYRINF